MVGFEKKEAEMDLDKRLLDIDPNQVAAPGAPHPPRAGTVTERRRAVRAAFPTPCPAQLQMREASLVNISRLGALAEHANPAWPGQVYHLSFVLLGTPVRLLARAVHAFASNRLPAAGGEGEIVFRTGLEFVAIEKDTGDFLSACVDGLGREGRADT
jgi:hypothetical protein